MNRRDALRSAAMAATGATMIGAADGAAASAQKVRSGPFIEATDGTRLYYRDWGTGARTALFVAPWSLNSDWWEYQMTYLSSAGVRCIAYDRRGHGRSDDSGRGYDFDTLANDLAAVIEHLALREITLIGHSMGCADAVRYLSRYPGRAVARVAMIATITPFILKTDDNPQGVERSVLEKGRETLSRDRPRNVAEAAPAFFGPKNGVSTQLMDWWTWQILQCPLRVMLELHRAFTETDFRPELRTITVPTLLIHGDIDTSAPLDFTGRRTAGLIPGSRLEVYEGAAHGLPITHMERLNRDLLSYVTS